MVVSPYRLQCLRDYFDRSCAAYHKATGVAAIVAEVPRLVPGSFCCSRTFSALSLYLTYLLRPAGLNER
jgi:hypothetical protein